MVYRSDFKKGDKIIFKYYGRLTYGTVISVGYPFDKEACRVMFTTKLDGSERTDSYTVNRMNLIDYDKALEDNLDIINLNIYTIITQFFIDRGRSYYSMEKGGIVATLIERIYNTLELTAPCELMADDNILKFKQAIDYKIGETILKMRDSIIAVIRSIYNDNIVMQFQESLEILLKNMTNRYGYDE